MIGSVIEYADSHNRLFAELYRVLQINSHCCGQLACDLDGVETQQFTPRQSSLILPIAFTQNFWLLT